MRTIPKLLFTALCILACDAHNAFATARYYSDITEESPAKKFKIEAISPDNADKEDIHRAFQKSFVYTFRDIEKNEVLWTRKQPPAEMKSGTDSKGVVRTQTIEKEGSPNSLFVSDDGWTVIWTGWSELIIVDITGKDRGIVQLLKNGFTEKENKEYVIVTTAGPRWTWCSLWYFLDAGEQPLFVIRPWWGRRVVLDLKSGSLISETPDIAKQAALWEKNHVLAELRRDADSPSKPSSRDNWRYITAAYVAGRDKITEAIPMLEELQNSTFVGMVADDWKRHKKGEVALSVYCATFPLRQVAQLSLRRLGKTPGQIPATQVTVEDEDNRTKWHPYVAKKIDGPRAANAGKIKTGMTPEEVLDLIGAPDSVGYTSRFSRFWEYDMDAPTPFTLIVHWDLDERDARNVARVEQKTPALWQDGLARERSIIQPSSMAPGDRWGQPD